MSRRGNCRDNAVVVDRLAVLIPPPRRHRYRYVGVLVAPNAPPRAVVTALAQPEAAEPLATPEVQPAAPDDDTAEPLHRKAARLAWAMLIARIYEVFPLRCPQCGGEMRIIAFITEGAAIREILGHLGEATSTPRLLPERGPPLWEGSGVETGDFVPQFQPAPDYEFDQQIAW